MKKSIIWSICFLLSILVCGCGGNEAAKETDFLTETKWKDFSDESIVVFNKDGTGEIYGRDSEWTLVDELLTVKYQASSMVVALEYDVIKTENLTFLRERASKYVGTAVLLKENSYKEECQKLKEYYLEHAEMLNWEEVRREIRSNAAKAMEEYNGMVVKWTAQVKRTTKDSCSMTEEISDSVIPLEPIDVYMSTEELIKCDVQDVVTVIGIFQVYNSPTIVAAIVVED